MHPNLRSFADDLRATFVRLLAYLGGIVLVGLIVAKFVVVPPAVEVEAREPAPPPVWTEVERAHPAFALAVTVAETDDAAPRYAIRRHVLGGRKDIIRWGIAGSATPSGLIEIYRPGAELEDFADTAAEVAARTADLGLVGRPTLLGTIDTKFGPLSLVDFATGPGTAPRNCLGFVGNHDEPRLQIAGWYCNGGPEIVDRGALACMLDKLTLLAGASEPKVAALFARAEVKRTFCGKQSPILAATPRRIDWIVAPAEPKLRGRLAAR